MKFSNGCWLQKERCECFSPAEVYFSKIEKDQVTICAPTSKITQRGDTLGSAQGSDLSSHGRAEKGTVI